MLHVLGKITFSKESLLTDKSLTNYFCLAYQVNSFNKQKIFYFHDVKQPEGYTQ